MNDLQNIVTQLIAAEVTNGNVEKGGLSLIFDQEIDLAVAIAKKIIAKCEAELASRFDDTKCLDECRSGG